MVRMEISGYTFDPRQVQVYWDALQTGHAVFSTRRSEIIEQMIPSRLRRLVPRIIRLLGDHPVIVAPLILDGETLGAINVTAPWLSSDDCAMVEALADHVAIALGHVHAQEEMRVALKRERVRNQVLEAIAQSTELAEVLEHVLRLAADVVGANAGAIALVEEGGELITYPYLFGLPSDLRFKPSPPGVGLVWDLLATGQPIVINDYPDHPKALPAWIESGVCALLGVPLIAGSDPVGGLGLFHINSDESFTEQQVEEAKAIAAMTAIAVQNARLYAQAKERAEEAQALIRTARSISSTLDQAAVLELIAEQAKHLLHAESSRIHLYEPELGVLRCVVALDPHAKEIMAIQLKPGEGLVGHVMQSGEGLLTNNPYEHPRGLQVPGTPEREQEALVLAPMQIRDRTVGVMTVRRQGGQQPFRDSDLELLTALAAQAAVSIENASLYSQVASQAQDLELEVAERTQDLAMSEERYRSLVENTLTGFAQTDEENRFVYINNAAAELIGQNPQELIGKSVLDALSPESAEYVDRRLRSALKGEGPKRDVFEIELLSKAGGSIPALIEATVIHDAEGLPTGTTSLIFDISQRKELEATVKRERDRLHAILANVGDAVFVMDRQGRIEYVNSAWERLTGYEADEAIGQTPKIMKSGMHPEDFYDEMWETILRGQTWSGEVVNRRKNESTYEAVVTVQSVLDDRGQILNLVGVQHDISALKEVDRLKSQFVSDVSHELRTPLTNVRLYLDLLQATDDRKKSDRYLETLIRESERLANLIEDLLSLSRLESGATPFHPEPVNICELLEALVDDRSSLAASLGLDLAIQCGAETPAARGDRKLLGQVFTNLLTNAMSYTPKGGRISVQADLHTNSTGQFVRAVVEDTGLGIRPEEKPLIFGRFYRGTASEKSGVAGTGLGLAICKEIAELHGGRITVESDENGSRFTVLLPVDHTL
jgi:PAS domain S-box-containing protein